MSTSPLFVSALFDHLAEELRRHNDWVLAVPQVSALPEPHLRTLDLFRSHVLLSVTAAGECTTLSGKTVRLIANDEILTLVTPNASASFADERVVKILHRESVFTPEGSNYTCLTLSRPLQGVGREPYFDDDITPVFVERTSQEWLRILTTEAPPTVMNELMRFSTSLPEDVLATAGKPRIPVIVSMSRDMAERCLANLVRSTRAFSFAQIDPTLGNRLRTALENVALSESHGAVFAALCHLHSAAERDLQRRILSLRSAVLEAGSQCEALGLSQAFLDDYLDSLALNSGALQMERLNDARCASDKLKVLAMVSAGAKRPLSADEEVPFTILSILQACPSCLLANCAYVQDFVPAILDHKLQFKRAVFVSAVNLLQQARVEDEGDGDDDADLDNDLSHSHGGASVWFINGTQTEIAKRNKPEPSMFSQLACGMGAR